MTSHPNQQKTVRNISEQLLINLKSITHKVGKTGRTVLANEIETQYVIIIGGPLLTYLLTGTDRLERAIVKEMNYRQVYSVIKDTKIIQ